MEEDAVAEGSGEPEADGPCPHLADLARQVAAEGVVHVEVDGVAMVCLTPLALAGLQPANPPTSPPGAALVPVLDQTQRRILHLIHRGLTASEVADVLDVDLRTLTHHLADIRGTYGVTSTREAVRRAVAAGAFPTAE